MSTTLAHSPATTSLPVHNHHPHHHHQQQQSSPPRPYPTIASAPPAVDPHHQPRRPRSHGTPDPALLDPTPTTGDTAAVAAVAVAAEDSSTTTTTTTTTLPPVIKKEPNSPLPSARTRPKRLDLSSSTSHARPSSAALPSAPLTSRDSAGLAIQDVGIACLSPGFQTNDPGMREQLQRSLNVRDRQRMIIEARQKGHRPPGAHDPADPASRPPADHAPFGVQMHTPTNTTTAAAATSSSSSSRRKGPPPGLSIHAPAATQFAHDRVIQSAPMHQTFTGLKPGEHPFSRHSQHGPSALGQTSHIHHVPATQTSHRLPPIADVFAHDRLDAAAPYHGSPALPSHSALPPLPSPGFGPPPPSSLPPPPQPQSSSGAPMSARAREFRSAEEAVHGLSGGRDELMPKVIHYGGVQPPTPPSPMPPAILRTHVPPVAAAATTTLGSDPATASRPAAETSFRPDVLNRTSSNGRRRGREEYERDNGSPPSIFNRSEAKRATVAMRGDDRDDDWRANMSSAEKRDEFLRLCERAWDLFHS
nr:hypothetical protein CFP56_64187 [Quercus suber]